VTVEATRPVPEPDADDAQFWQSLADGRILTSRCGKCGRSWLRLMPGCPFCGATDISTRPSVDIGSLYTWVVVHRALDESFADAVPYTIVVVDLDDGARVNARLLDDSVLLTAGMRMRLVPYRSGAWHLLGALGA
jgi:uncharacterized protein